MVDKNDKNSMEHYIEKKVLSSDGQHELAGRVYLPHGTPRGYFHVVHGMTEHIARYDAFMRQMADDGYICFGYDHLGHGHTARSPEEWGFVAHKQGWTYLCRDVGLFAAAVKAAYPAPAGETYPYILMGHSMGSFIVRCAVGYFGVAPDRLVIMGTGGPNPAAGVGLAVIRVIKAFRGDKHISNVVDKLAFGSYNDRCKAENDSRAWLTTDRKVRRVYDADPMCTFRFTVSAMQDLVTLNKWANARAWFRGMDRRLPILLVSGTDDPVGNYGTGVKTVYDKLKAQGCNAKMHLYEGARHEILNDACREQVISDIRAFLSDVATVSA